MIVKIFLIKYFKCEGEGHGTGPNHDVAKEAMRDMIFSQGTGGTGGTGGGTGGGSTAPPTSPPSYEWTDKDYLVSPSAGQDTNTQSGRFTK